MTCAAVVERRRLLTRQGREMAQPEKIENTKNFARWLTLLGWLAILTFAFHAVTHMTGAADTFKALAAGRHHISFRLDTTDPFSAGFLNRFTREKNLCEAEDGYFNKLMAATTAITYLGRTAEQHGNFILAQSYNTKLKDLRNERQKLLETKTW